MSSTGYEFLHTARGEVLRIAARGRDVLNDPLTNIGTAFSQAQREALGLKGLLPPGHTTLEAQARRVMAQLEAEPDDLAKHQFLQGLHNRNEVLFHKVFIDHIEDLLPIVYTPTIGEAIKAFSNYYHRPRGIFLSIDDPDSMEQALQAYGHGQDDVDLIVVTDSEGILGIGDQGVGGIQIAIGKLAVYTAAAGIHPRRVLPVVLDVGTDNLDLLAYDGYLGVRHSRVRGQRYDEFIDHFVATTSRLFPKAMIHWEDFGAGNAHRILARYHDEICTFNDDIEGTAAVVTAAAVAASRRSGIPLTRQRIVIFGAGSAGIGIAQLMCEFMTAEGMDLAEARSRFWGLGSRGLLREGIRMRDFQRPFARRMAELEDWQLERDGRCTLRDVVRNVRPTMMIGTSAQPGVFDEALVREMASHVAAPIIMPLSNPTSLAEAQPEELLEWTDGRALIATGSPFSPVVRGSVSHQIAQANNALVFPGLGLGVIVARATRITPGMLVAAANAVAAEVTARHPGAGVLPAMSSLRAVSAKVALAVARAAETDGVACIELKDPVQQVLEAMWEPVYPDIEIV
ncbi:NAD-dependent malic enzyme [Arachnia propionica]|uniref:Putative malate oxidoreductase [NAD] n=1 Tax=Arachnia propionica TaxID=1750 RepID=A0A3P1TCX3_9ACTN|nr:NAD-dependent malic enzyme [Arachnia propionica]RRD07297.1 NAD-dependent malic enzyme [Arachnia propionica]